MIEVLIPVNNRKCDCCDSNEDVAVLKLSESAKIAICKKCRNDLKNLQHFPIVFMGRKEEEDKQNGEQN